MGSAVRDVHRDLEAEAHVLEGGLGPLHGNLLWGCETPGPGGSCFARRVPRGIAPCGDTRTHRWHREIPRPTTSPPSARAVPAQLPVDRVAADPQPLRRHRDVAVCL